MFDNLLTIYFEAEVINFISFRKRIFFKILFKW